MEPPQRRTKARRRRFNEERFIRATSSQEMQPGTHRDMQMRPILRLDTLRSSVHDDLRRMRTSTLFSLILAGLYIALVTVESEASYSVQKWSLSDAVKCVAAGIAGVQVLLSIVYYNASLRIRKLRGFTYEGSNVHTATLGRDASFPLLIFEAAILLLIVPPFVNTPLHFREVSDDSTLPLGDLMLGLSCLRAFLVWRAWFVFSHLLEQRETFLW